MLFRQAQRRVRIAALGAGMLLVFFCGRAAPPAPAAPAAAPLESPTAPPAAPPAPPSVPAAVRPFGPSPGGGLERPAAAVPQPSVWGLLLVVVVYVAVLGGLGWLVVWLYRRGGRLGNRGREGGLEVVQQRVLGPRQVVAVVRYRDYEYILGVTPQQITRLDARPVDEAAAEARLAAALAQAPARPPDATP